MNFWSRLSTYFDLTPDISLEPGISGMWNPHTDAPWRTLRRNPHADVAGNTLTERERRLLGADLVLSYMPLRNNQFKSVTWGTEVLYSDNRYDVTDALRETPSPAAPSALSACTRISPTSSTGSGQPGSCSTGWRTP